MNSKERAGRTTVVITSPLESDHATRIADAFPDRIELIYRPDLMPPPRYRGDHDGDPGWTRSTLQESEWQSLLARADVWWDFPAGETRHPLGVAPSLSWVQTTSAGVGQLARRLGLRDDEVIVTTASGTHGLPLAEFVFGALLFHTRQFRRLLDDQQHRHWERFSSVGLAGQVMAIVGPGRIGREVARIARAFQMDVWAMGRDNTPARANALGVDRLFARSQLRKMLAGADVVVLCAPHTPETEDMIGRSELASMRAGAVLINIARGAMVDEVALVDEIERGRIGFAALDVFRNEPLPPESPFWTLPNVLVSPHSASTVDSENGTLTELFIRNLGCFLDGRIDEMQPRLDLNRLY